MAEPAKLSEFDKRSWPGTLSAGTRRVSTTKAQRSGYAPSRHGRDENHYQSGAFQAFNTEHAPYPPGLHLPEETIRLQMARDPRGIFIGCAEPDTPPALASPENWDEFACEKGSERKT
ncbi:hypothetical protein BP5796_02718 [Coleophoma crateriformis]|uniref:Uncharacterized protein n=1 Tax=Coleophoma crateriformis TaxID=565419 RepID=A0A3D8SZ01_9HELO|nr:hypothetical protein BP5796_02718 [Coleophoma crateriformis]